MDLSKARKPPKQFDCVQFKAEMQARVREANRGLTEEEAMRRLHQRLARSQSPLAKLWRAAGARQRKPAKTSG